MNPKRTIIRPHPRDSQLSPIPVDFDPETLGWILDEGGRGNLTLQNELFNTMEDAWERLRGNLNKLKNAVCKLPFNLQPWTEKGQDPSESALEKAAFVEHVLHNQKAATWEGQHNFHGTIYELLEAIARAFADLLGTTDLSTHDLVWTGGDCETCSPLNGTKFGEGWLAPPPLHHNCDCAINVRPKA